MYLKTTEIKNTVRNCRKASKKQGNNKTILQSKNTQRSNIQ